MRSILLAVALFSCGDGTTNNIASHQHRLSSKGQKVRVVFSENSVRMEGGRVGGRKRKMTPVREHLRVKSSLHWFSYKHLALLDIQEVFMRLFGQQEAQE